MITDDELNSFSIDKNKIDKKKLGEKIYYIRNYFGYNMEEFGEFVDGASQSVVSRWESGKSIPNKKRLLIIAKIASVNINDLLYSENLFSKDNNYQQNHNHYYDDYDYKIINFDSFEKAHDLIKFILEKNGLSDDILLKYVKYIFENDKENYKVTDITRSPLVLKSEDDLLEWAKTIDDSTIKQLSHFISENLYEGLMLHYKLCELLRIESDTKQMDWIQKSDYLFSIKEAYFMNQEYKSSFDFKDVFDDSIILKIDNQTISKEEINILKSLVDAFRTNRKNKNI